MELSPVADFATALDLEPRRTDAAWSRLMSGLSSDDRVEWFSYARRSFHAPQLARWLEMFPREALLVMTMEELADDPGDVVRKALVHVGVNGTVSLPDFRAKNTRAYHQLSAGQRMRLFEQFAEDTRELERLIGRPTGWI